MPSPPMPLAHDSASVTRQEFHTRQRIKTSPEAINILTAQRRFRNRPSLFFTIVSPPPFQPSTTANSQTLSLPQYAPRTPWANAIVPALFAGKSIRNRLITEGAREEAGFSRRIHNKKSLALFCREQAPPHPSSSRKGNTSHQQHPRRAIIVHH